MLPPDSAGERAHPAAGRSPASTAEHLSRTARSDASAGPGAASDASGPTGADRPLPKITLEKKKNNKKSYLCVGEPAEISRDEPLPSRAALGQGELESDSENKQA